MKQTQVKGSINDSLHLKDKHKEVTRKIEDKHNLIISFSLQKKTGK